MLDTVKLREIINERSGLDVECDYEIDQCRANLVKVLTRDIAATNQYLLEECSEEEFLWISEVFDEIARITMDDEFIHCLYQLMAKYEKITEQYNIRLDVEEAEGIIESEKNKIKNRENSISSIVRSSSEIHCGSAIDDGCNPELLERALFEGKLEIPMLQLQEAFKVPKSVIPFNACKQIKSSDSFVLIDEKGIPFRDILRDPSWYVRKCRRHSGVMLLDLNSSSAMTIVGQINRVYRNRTICHVFQESGIPVIPNVRWWDKNSYSPELLGECFAFLGIPKHAVVSVRADSCDSKTFYSGFEAMIKILDPSTVVMADANPNDPFMKEYGKRIRIVFLEELMTGEADEE